MSLRLIIFDLDGTLVDTSEDITSALNHAVTPFGIKGLSVEDVKKIVGEGITRLIEKILGEGKAASRDEALRRFLDYYSAHLTDCSRPYPHVAEVLRRLEGFKKAVISNKRESLSRKLLENLGLLKYLDLVVGSDTSPEKKPSPVPVLYVLEKLGVVPDEAVIVGDSNYDIEAGKGAGVRTVAVTYGYRPVELLRDADYMIDNLEELIPLLYGREEMLERRRETRHPVPEIYREYIRIEVKVGGEFVHADLLDFSERGIKIQSPVPFDAGDERECIVSIPLSLTKDVGFKITVRHCLEDEGLYIVGAEIKEVEDEVWFRMFGKVHDFIAQKAYFRREEG